MRAVIQRVTRASVTVNGEIVGEIGNGLVVLLGIARDDTEKDATYLIEKIAALRIFDTNVDRMRTVAAELEASSAQSIDEEGMGYVQKKDVAPCIGGSNRPHSFLRGRLRGSAPRLDA